MNSTGLGSKDNKDQLADFPFASRSYNSSLYFPALQELQERALTVYLSIPFSSAKTSKKGEILLVGFKPQDYHLAKEGKINFVHEQIKSPVVEKYFSDAIVIRHIYTESGSQISAPYGARRRNPPSFEAGLARPISSNE